MKFQSPQQMDRENQQLKRKEEESNAADDSNAADEDASFNNLSPEFKTNQPLPDLVEVACLPPSNCWLFIWFISKGTNRRRR